MWNEDGGKKYECPDCDKGFTTKRRADEHMLDHTGERPHSCDKCDAKFKQKHSLDRHQEKNH